MAFRRDDKTAKGQATWPEPLLGEICSRCALFETHNVAESQIAKGMGRCLRVAQLRGGHPGVQFNGKSVACGEFSIEAED